ncbi:MAG TPA: late competence protein ComER [Bacillaceae bacterium]
MKVGIIGTGNMGTILTEALLDGKAVCPSDMIVTNRTKSKAYLLTHNYPGAKVADSPADVIKQAELIFICVKPLDMFPILNENKELLTKDKCLVSITSPIKVSWLEEVLECVCARVIPSITNRALAGVSLLTFGERDDGNWRKKLTELFSHISVPLEISEAITRVSSDIVSCGPAFFSFLARGFIEAAVEETNINRETATMLTEEMLIGLGELLKRGYYTLPTLEEKVCVKGGITGEGIKVLEQEMGEMFHKLYRATHAKFGAESALIEADFKR